MLTSITNLPIRLLPHHPPQHRQRLPQAHHLALNQQLRAHRRRPQVAAVERARHMSRVPEALARHGADGHGGQDIEDECYGASVQVGRGVAEGHGHGEAEGCVPDVAVSGRNAGGEERYVWVDCCVVELEIGLETT